jgi:hypothetical protein
MERGQSYNLCVGKQLGTHSSTNGQFVIRDSRLVIGEMGSGDWAGRFRRGGGGEERKLRVKN